MLLNKTSVIGGILCIVSVGLATQQARPGRTKGTPEDEAAITRYVENFESTWNNHDGNGLFGDRASEIDRINAFGGWIRDPEADARVMRRLLSGPFKQNPHQARTERIRFLTSDVALAVVHITRPTGAPTGSMTALGTRSMHVLVKHEGRWELTGFANVPINPPSGAIREAEGDDVVYSKP